MCMTGSNIVIGADIGGSHITAAPVDVVRRQLIHNSLIRQTVLPRASVAELLGTWAEAISHAMHGIDTSQVCVSMPGPFHYDEGICLIRDQNKYPGLYGVNVKEELAKLLGIASTSVYLRNDAACFLEGEVFCGSLRGYNKSIGVTLGTGLGSAVYQNGVAVSADLWNMPFENGIAEDFLCTRWFVKQFYTLSGVTVEGVKELCEYAETDSRVNDIFNDFGTHLGMFLNRFIERFQPQAVVIGGNISKAFMLFSEALHTALQPGSAVPVFTSVMGEHAALIGAAGSWHNTVSVKGGRPSA